MKKHEKTKDNITRSYNNNKLHNIFCVCINDDMKGGKRMITYKKENDELQRKLAYEQVKVKNRDELISKQSDANQELRQDCEDFIRAYRKIKELLKQNDYNSIINLKNKINTILTDCNLDKYRM